MSTEAADALCPAAALTQRKGVRPLGSGPRLASPVSEGPANVDLIVIQGDNVPDASPPWNASLPWLTFDTPTWYISDRTTDVQAPCLRWDRAFATNTWYISDRTTDIQVPHLRWDRCCGS